jgi:hypothetical protein
MKRWRRHARSRHVRSREVSAATMEATTAVEAASMRAATETTAGHGGDRQSEHCRRRECGCTNS